jgi:hypothetical protein
MGSLIVYVLAPKLANSALRCNHEYEAIRSLGFIMERDSGCGIVYLKGYRSGRRQFSPVSPYVLQKDKPVIVVG